MRGPTRRRVLQGISTGGVVLGATRWSQGIDRGAARASTGVQDTGGDGTPTLEVDIIETDAPVYAGEFLNVTTAITNHGSSAVRTTVELLVGNEPNRLGRRQTPIDPGETRTVKQGFYTYPVPSYGEFPVRVETDDGADERTVSVIGASSLPTARPDPDVTIEPGTDVLFEAGAIDPSESQWTVWWLDGEQVAGGPGGPWDSVYYGVAEAHYWRHTFDSPGTHDVAAAVLPQDRAGSYAARWQVEVTGGGHRSPTVEPIRPDPGTVPAANGEPTTFELEATDPDGGLDRVVWWLTQSDVILDVTELEGRTDTAQLTTDSGCHTCQIIPWVICEDGTVASLDSHWQFERGDRGDGGDDDDTGDGDDGSDGDNGSGDGAELELSIRTTNSPVDAGEYLEVIVDITNTGSETGRQTLELIVGHDPKKLDTQDVVVEPGETGAATLGFETYPTKQDEQFPVRVRGADDTAVVSVQVFAK
ncbi:hypothetical protein [Halopiger aswanensis]|uniref:CARDB protein n=1 Tax=Halopiger aswanensis TaxID=148449 RepID=A0A3R7EG82_9EURY|nr:hypothetical protein [Halopiger aswanensis]RKD95953.1 hypothetical protein ATJ93_2816 [Halopiger aswanensis]